jgi:tRNA pseudouridine55 synthase
VSRPAGRPEGLLLVDKPQGITSHDAVGAVRRALGIKKVGHAGTLDPMATGLLVVGVGRATRLLRFLGDLPKSYEGTMRLGVTTTTLDADGEVVLERQVPPMPSEAIEAAMRSKLGRSLQRPPAFSAVKVGGRKLYDAARKGEDLQAAPRAILVERFAPSAIRLPDVDFVAEVGGGTYVRVLVADVGDALGCGAHLTRLRRTAIGALSVAAATPPDEPGAPMPVERAVAHLPRVDLDPEEARAASNGTVLAPAGVDGPYGVFGPDGSLIGVWRDHGAQARPEVVLASPE